MSDATLQAIRDRENRRNPQPAPEKVEPKAKRPRAITVVGEAGPEVFGQLQAGEVIPHEDPQDGAPE